MVSKDPRFHNSPYTWRSFLDNTLILYLISLSLSFIMQQPLSTFISCNHEKNLTVSFIELIFFYQITLKDPLQAHFKMYLNILLGGSFGPEGKAVIFSLENGWSNLQSLQYACQSVLRQDTEPQTALERFHYVSVCVKGYLPKGYPILSRWHLRWEFAGSLRMCVCVPMGEHDMTSVAKKNSKGAK